MNESEAVVVRFRDGLRGVLEPEEACASAGPVVGKRRVVVRLDDGRRMMVAHELLKPREGGGYDLAVGRADVERLAGEGEEVVVPLIEERAEVSTRWVVTGKLRVEKTVTERTEEVDLPLAQEEVEVERVAVNRVVDGPVEVRREGDTLIVPVLEEVLVVEKRLMLREEVRITTRRTEIHKPQSVTLRREEAKVTRAEPGGNPPDLSKGSDANSVL